MRSSFPAPANTQVLVAGSCEPLRAWIAALQVAGYQLLYVGAGTDLISATVRERPTVVIFDPAIADDPVAVLAAFKARSELAQIPVLAVLPRADDGMIDRLLDAGVDDFVVAPADDRIFVARVRGLVRAASSRRAIEANRTVARERDTLVEELREALREQRSRLPPPREEGWRVAGTLVPTGQLGGDIVDVLADDEDLAMGILVDISGHGTAAALMAEAVRGQLRVLLQSMPLGPAIESLNRALCRETSGRYACVGAVTAERNRALLVNAGLPPCVLLRAGRIVQTLASTSAPPGLFAESEYEPTAVDLEVGDRLVFVSDGLTEPFGFSDEVEPCLRALGLLDGSRWSAADWLPEALSSRILAAFERHGLTQTDDATLLVVERVE